MTASYLLGAASAIVIMAVAFGIRELLARRRRRKARQRSEAFWNTLVAAIRRGVADDRPSS